MAFTLLVEALSRAGPHGGLTERDSGGSFCGGYGSSDLAT